VKEQKVFGRTRSGHDAKLSASLCSAPLVLFARSALSTITSCGSPAKASSPPPTAPSVAIVANPTTIPQGSSSTLTVTASNATQVVLSDNSDSNTFTLAVSGETQKVTPTSNTIYTATATGPGGMVTAKAANHRDRVDKGSRGRDCGQSQPQSRRAVPPVSPKTTTTYTATATGAGGSATAQYTVGVTPPAR
jgi:hypothetical protein